MFFMKQGIITFIGVVAFIVLLATIGGIEAETISFLRGTITAAISLVVMWFCVKYYKTKVSSIY